MSGIEGQSLLRHTLYTLWIDSSDRTAFHGVAFLGSDENRNTLSRKMFYMVDLDNDLGEC
jgi:hypothetical protein